MSLNKVSMSSRAVSRQYARRRLLAGGAVLVPIALAVLGRMSAGPSAAAVPTVGSVLVLAVPAFLAGLLSFLSPCTLPILPTYFALTFQTQRERIVQTTLAFFLGLATTMVVLGATASAFSQLLVGHLRSITLVGGLIVIGFGVLSMLGKGFSGVQLLHRPTASIAGSYVYGATFALGWTACVGPILGALLTLLATQGVAVLGGALLAFIYALGLGTPLIISASVFRRVGPTSRVWRLMRGRGFSVNLGFTTLHLHTTSVVSGLLLIGVGLLLATGQLAVFSQWAVQMPLTQQILQWEDYMRNVLLGR